MAEYVQFLILGLGSGAIIAAVALGLVLTYRASGVINFAQGAMASWTAYTYYSLQTDGSLPLPPLPEPIPAFVEFGSPWSPVAALICALAVAALLGLLIHVLVFRPLRFAPLLAKIAASAGLMLALQAAIVLQFGSSPKRLDALLPDDPVDALGITVGADRYLLLALVVLAAVTLWLLYTRTGFGLATRAAAEDERAAALVGIPADRLAAINWVLASVLAGAIGIFASAITALSPVGLTLVVVPALAAALLAGFSSFGVALAGGVGIGMLQSELLFFGVKWDWWPDVGLGQALPLLVIGLVMFVGGRSLPDRGAVRAIRLPLAYAPPLNRIRGLGYGALVIGATAAVLFLPFDYRGALNSSMIGVLLALSLVVVTGFVGQISLAQLSLAGFAAFGLATFETDAGIPFPIGLLAAVAAATLVGLLFALPALRTRGASLAIITLAGGIAIQEVFFAHEGWFGAVSARVAEAPYVFGLEFGPRSSFLIGDGSIPTAGFGLFLLAVTVLACFGVMRLRRSRLGAQMLAVRANERAAAAAGVNVAAIKGGAFAISAALAGLGGAMIAYNLESFTAESFSVFGSLTLFALAYIGGISTVGGAVWTGVLYTAGVAVVLTAEIVDIGQYQAYIAGLGLVLTVILYPEGIDGANRQMAATIARLLHRRAQPATVMRTAGGDRVGGRP
jgi:branched-chain amino acid transport system permease protein